MADEPIELNGVLLEDGTVVLDRIPALQPGPVRVALRYDQAAAQTPVWQTLQQIWADQRARGHVSRSKEEIDADLAAMRDEDEDRITALERLQEECARLRQQPPTESP